MANLFYFQAGKKATPAPAPATPATPAKKNVHKRAAPIAGGLRKNKPNYAKMIDMALRRAALPKKGMRLKNNEAHFIKNFAIANEIVAGLSSVEIRKWIESRYPVPDNCARTLRLGKILFKIK